jgi:ATP-dependent Clp protease adaptor protein ClpS
MTMEKEQLEYASDVVEDDDAGVRTPRRFAVILHNDNYTTMEFVVHVLITVFHHSQERAATLMRTVHEKGSASAGEYTRDIAETKAAQAMAMARREGFPLRCSLKEV